MNAGRSGYSTGTCAAAAAKAAAMVLCGRPAPREIEVSLPDGTRVTLSTVHACRRNAEAEVAVRKDAGDDVDVTHGAMVSVSVSFAEGGDVTFAAGEGVGTVTRPGLVIPPGEPAINPVPRGMIQAAVREVTDRPIKVTISIPGGRKLAERTFNPRLGVAGGLSILGTTGRVRPFSLPALREALKCSLGVAAGCGVLSPVLVPGRIGEKAAREHFRLSTQQVIEVGNEWGFILDHIPDYRFERVLVLGHPGKLAKLAMGQWDTHSARSSRAVPYVVDLAARVLGRTPPECPTVEGIFGALPAADRATLAADLAGKVREEVMRRVRRQSGAAVALVDMRGDLLGSDGDTIPWR
ncbi:MAG: cobalamin biosynthesis protein CbiD [Deltaproteobacteria bacterium]|nr:cobalamin biosynthesis protein CbiD [Deltaproteobacteria bacterium]